jgi:hypothetical protein
MRNGMLYLTHRSEHKELNEVTSKEHKTMNGWPVAYAYEADTWCPNCLPVEDNEENSDVIGAIFEHESSEYERGLYCNACHEEIFPDRCRVTLIDDDSNSLAMTVEVERLSSELDNTEVWTGKAYSATITLIDFGESETFTFYTMSNYEPSSERALNDIREMMAYSEDYATALDLYKDYSTQTRSPKRAVSEALALSARWYESVMLRNAIRDFFSDNNGNKWYKHFVNGDYSGEEGY